jgi:uncharacterized protein (DUF427 family)
MKLFGPDHPITVEPESRRVRVVVAGAAVAETRNALRLQEAQYPPVFYVPRSDIRADCFVASARTSHCPYKGDPYPAVAAIRDHVAFYPDRVDAIVLED